MKEFNLDYDIEAIHLPITLNYEDKIIKLTLDSDAISDETLHMIFEDIDKELEKRGYVNETI